MKLIFTAILCLFSFSCFAELTTTCVFDTYTAVYSENDNEAATILIAKTMTIKNGITSEETKGLDGGMRATNSSKWMLVENEFMNLSKIHYAGDTGELLTIFHEVGEKNQSLKGTYKASLISSGFYQSNVQYGLCTIH
jgi:hypothetical protein